MYTEKSCALFLKELSSKSPTPGGGGASAFAGALGTALGHMVGNLTIGKKKYENVEDEILLCNAKAERLENIFLTLVEEDAKAFLPLSEAYKLSSETKEDQVKKEKVLEKALLTACAVPMQMMETCEEALALLEQYAVKGSMIAISDAGVGAALIRAALEGAGLNVFVNTRFMKDRKVAVLLEEKADHLLACLIPRAESIVHEVTTGLRQKKEQ